MTILFPPHNYGGLKMSHRLSIIIAFILCTLALSAQTWTWWPTGITNDGTGGDSLYYDAGIKAVVSSGQYAPFWLHSRTNGDVSVMPMSGNIYAGIVKTTTRQDRWFDYDFGVVLTGRVQGPRPEAIQSIVPTATGYFNQLYAHIRLYIFDITAGIQPMLYETEDTLLSSGSLLFSGNSHPIPRITIGVEKWTAFPGLFGYVAFKGGMTHGWINDNVYIKKTKLHHAYAGLQLGGNLPINIAYEIHHVAQWGGYSPVYGDLGNDWNSFVDAVLGRSGGSNLNDQLNAHGNHLISQQWSLTAKWSQWRITAYWQNLSEDNPAFIGFGQNATDGLWGLSIKQSQWPFINAFTFELLNTTSQSGPWHDRDGLCYAGDDRYYQNSVYVNGWNYFYQTIGTPFITSPIYNTDGTIHTLNSRARVYHVGLRGDIYGYQWRALVSHAKNYGNNNASRLQLSQNTAWMVEVSKYVEKAWGLEFSIQLAGDIGSQFGNTFGTLISIRKNGLITSW